jgi:dTDP-4-dehydrorhamnose reductase
MKVIVLGISGMIGYTLFSSLLQDNSYDTVGVLRSASKVNFFSSLVKKNIIRNIDVLDIDQLVNVFDEVKPDIVINCIGLVKQQSEANNPLITLPINSIFPHRLANICSLIQARLIHLSTDCVFSGAKGHYLENDTSDAHDLYGKSKYIGELTGIKNTLTIRTSAIGHELTNHYSLVDWFLSQTESVNGYVNAIYSGLPTIELAHVIKNYVLPNKDLCGLYHVSSNPINKYELLSLIAERYAKSIHIKPDIKFSIDRSLCGDKFNKKTGYAPPEWPILIEKMHQSGVLFKETVNV